LANDGNKPLPAEYGTENFLRIDVTTLRRTFLWPELVVFRTKGGVRERLVCDCDFFETFLGIGVIWILVWMVLDRQTAYKVTSQSPGEKDVKM
jgi:hypothetical protein